MTKQQKRALHGYATGKSDEQVTRSDVASAIDLIVTLKESNERLKSALRAFSNIGNPADYDKRPRRLDVPFEWYERAWKTMEEEGKP